MRTRKLLAALLLAAVAVLGVSGTASTHPSASPSIAQDGEGEGEGGGEEVAVEEEELSHDAEECLEILENGGEPDDCQEAPSPILPATDELIWSILSFTILFLLLWKFAWPGIKKALAARTDRIRDDLEAAEKAKLDAQQTQAAYEERLAEAKSEAARIIEDARQTADATKAERNRALDAEISEKRQQALADIEQSKAQAMSELQGEVASLAIGAAEHVVEQNLDEAANRRLVESFIESVGSR